MTAIDTVLAALEERGCSPRGSTERGYVACCPSHDDRSPSLSVSYKNDRVLLHCHTGCQPEAVLDALALEFRDLYDEDA